MRRKSKSRCIVSSLVTAMTLELCIIITEAAIIAGLVLMLRFRSWLDSGEPLPKTLDELLRDDDE